MCSFLRVSCSVWRMISFVRLASDMLCGVDLEVVSRIPHLCNTAATFDDIGTVFLNHTLAGAFVAPAWFVVAFPFC